MGSLSFFFLKSKRVDLTYLLIGGLFFQTLFVCFYGVFSPIDDSFYLINSVISIGLLYSFRKNLKRSLNIAVQSFKSWKNSLKFLFGIVFLLSLMQSSVAPIIPDNESYYLQTIQWLNEYGLVKGLANLHMFLGQMSGLHLLQSSFNFGFAFDFLNSINGFILMIGAFFSFNALNRFFKRGKLIDLVVGLVFLATPFLLRFLDSPSPDLPVYVIFPIALSVFYKNYRSPRKDAVLALYFFALLLILIKVTSFPILLLPFVLSFRYWKFKRLFWPSAVLCGLALLAFGVRNLIITGYLLYPFDWFGSFITVDWRLPPEILNMYYVVTEIYAYHTTDMPLYKSWSFGEKFLHWITLPKLHGLFNKLMILSLIATPFFVWKDKALRWVYVLGALQFFVLLLTSPQYRFFFHILLIFSLIILAQIIINQNHRWMKIALGCGVFIGFIPLLIPFGAESFSTNPLMDRDKNTFEIDYLVQPHANIQKEYEYEIKEEGNLLYRSPIDRTFWLTGDGEIPVLNEIMLKYTKNQFGLRPQLRTGNLKDGFYTEKMRR